MLNEQDNIAGFSTEDVNMLGLEQTPTDSHSINDDIYIEPETIERRLYVLSNRADLQSLAAERMSDTEKTKGVHLAFRPSSKDIIVLTNKLPGLEIIQIPKSYRRSFSRAMCMYLDNIDIALIEGDVWGHRKDIDEWANVKILKSKYEDAISRFSKKIRLNT